MSLSTDKSPNTLMVDDATLIAEGEAPGSERFVSDAINFGIAGAVGIYFGVALWLWKSTGESLVIATALAGLPTCF